MGCHAVAEAREEGISYRTPGGGGEWKGGPAFGGLKAAAKTNGVRCRGGEKAAELNTRVGGGVVLLAFRNTFHNKMAG